MQIEGRDHQFFQAGITGQARKCIKYCCDFLRQFRFAREQTEVGVNARRTRMIIARAELDVTPELVRIAANNEQRLAMGFQADDTVNDVSPGFFQAPGPLNVGRLIEARTQFDNGSDLFSGVGRVDECFDDRGITTCAIEGDLDCEHLRILRRRLDPLDNLIEAIVGMMQQHVLTPQHFEKIGMRR